MNNVNLFPAIMASCPLIYLSNLSITDKIALSANLAKIFLANETERSISVFCLITCHIGKRSGWRNYFRQLTFNMFYICQHIVKESISCFGFISYF